MSIAARFALALVALAILAGGVVIFYILPQLEATDTAQPAPAVPQPATVAAANPTVPAQPVNTAPPPAGSDIPTQPSPAPSDQTPAPDQTPPDQTPPAPPEPVSPVPGAPIPLAPATSAPAASDQAAPAAPFDPALPGVGNIAAALNQSLLMAGTADARTEPRADAPVLVRLDKGNAVTVTAIMAGQLWLQVELSDHQLAYIPAAALPQAVSAAGLGAGANTAGGPAPAPASGPPSFMADAETLTAASRTPIYGAPDPTAPVQGVLPAGTKVQIVAKSTDGQWGWLQTTDGNPAYVRMASLSALGATATLPDMITGRVKVLTTASLVVDGQRIGLYGVKGMGGSYARQLRALIDSRGGILTCTRRDALYVCSLPGNLDIARAALYNGAAHPADDASPDYREQADAARLARRGVWAR
jgi:hypothetical protein